MNIYWETKQWCESAWVITQQEQRMSMYVANKKKFIGKTTYYYNRNLQNSMGRAVIGHFTKSLVAGKKLFSMTDLGKLTL